MRSKTGCTDARLPRRSIVTPAGRLLITSSRRLLHLAVECFAAVPQLRVKSLLDGISQLA